MAHKPIVIAGPCSAENDEQIDIAIEEAGKRGVDYMRTNLWKPRDKPAWDGLKEKGLYHLTKVAQAGLNPALEVMFPDHVTMAMDATLPHLKEGGKLLSGSAPEIRITFCSAPSRSKRPKTTVSFS